MADYLDTLHDGLVDASRRLAKPRRRWKRFGALGVLIVVVTAPALAATGVWRPPIGDGKSPAPPISTDAPPPAQLDQFAILRRPQIEADRGAAARAALKLVNGTSVKGIRTDSVRLIAAGGPDRGIVLIPVTRLEPQPLPEGTPKQLRERLQRPAIDDALCIWQLDVDGAGVACWSTKDIREGRAWMSLGQRAVWLVTDQVARIRIEYPGEPARELAVHENVALDDDPHVGERTVTFLDANGGTVLTIDPPKPDPSQAFTGETGPVPPGSTHHGGVRRIAIKGSGLDARYELILRPPQRKRRQLISLVLERPACAGKRHVTKSLGAPSVPATGALGIILEPSTADPGTTRWCPGTYRGAYRYKGETRPFGTFSFRVP